MYSETFLTLRALAAIWDEMPGLIGPTWRTILPKIIELSDRLRKAIIANDLIRVESLGVDLMDLFADFPAFCKRWGEEQEKLRNEPARTYAALDTVSASAFNIGPEFNNGLEAIAQIRDLAIPKSHKEPEAAPPEKSEPTVQADVFLVASGGEQQKLEKAFVSDQPHQVDIWIGSPGEGSISADSGIPVDKLPEGSCQLTVTFREANHSPKLQTTEITYSSAIRKSTKCQFGFKPHPDVPTFNGELTFFYQETLLQTLFLQGKVVGDLAQVKSDEIIRLKVESHPGDFSGPSTRDASLVVEMESNDLRIRIKAQGKDKTYRIRGFATYNNLLSQQLAKIAKTPRNYQALTDDEPQMLLNTLARHGYRLYKELSKKIGAGHPVFQPDTQRILLLSRDDALIPLEFVYVADVGAATSAKLCDSALNALQEGKCTCSVDQKKAAMDGNAICPLQFWGLSKFIERYTISATLGDEDEPPRLNPTRAIPALKVGASAVVAASDRVDSKDIAALSEAVKDNLSQASGVLSDWNAWENAVKQFKPTLLLLVPHAEDQEGFLALEIGHNNFLAVDQVERDPLYIHSQPSDHPIALVLGCSTASAELPFESCSAYFRRAGAAMTVTTLSSVLGRHAVPVAKILLQELKAATTENLSFGEVFLRTRQHALAQGLLMVLTLVADGNMDWEIA